MRRFLIRTIAYMIAIYWLLRYGLRAIRNLGNLGRFTGRV